MTYVVESWNGADAPPWTQAVIVGVDVTIEDDDTNRTDIVHLALGRNRHRAVIRHTTITNASWQDVGGDWVSVPLEPFSADWNFQVEREIRRGFSKGRGVVIHYLQGGLVSGPDMLGAQAFCKRMSARGERFYPTRISAGKIGKAKAPDTRNGRVIMSPSDFAHGLYARLDRGSDRDGIVFSGKVDPEAVVEGSEALINALVMEAYLVDQVPSLRKLLEGIDAENDGIASRCISSDEMDQNLARLKCGLAELTPADRATKDISTRLDNILTIMRDLKGQLEILAPGNGVLVDLAMAKAARELGR